MFVPFSQLQKSKAFWLYVSTEMAISGSGSGSSALSVSGQDVGGLSSATAALSVIFGKAATNIFGF